MGHERQRLEETAIGHEFFVDITHLSLEQGRRLSPCNDVIEVGRELFPR